MSRFSVLQFETGISSHDECASGVEIGFDSGSDKDVGDVLIHARKNKNISEDCRETNPKKAIAAARTTSRSPHGAAGPSSRRLPRSTQTEALPGTPAQLERYERPSRKDVLSATAGIQRELQACFAQLSASSEIYERCSDTDEQRWITVNRLRKQISGLSKTIDLLYREKAAMTEKLVAMNGKERHTGSGRPEQQGEFAGAGRFANDALKGLRTVVDLEMRLQSQQHRLQTENLPLTEEKRIVAQVSFLEGRGRLLILQRQAASAESASAPNEGLTPSQKLVKDRNCTYRKIQSNKAQRAAIVSQPEIVLKEDEAASKIVPGLLSISEREAIKRRIGKLKGEIQQAWKTFAKESRKLRLTEDSSLAQKGAGKQHTHETGRGRWAPAAASRETYEEQQRQMADRALLCSRAIAYLERVLIDSGEEGDSHSQNAPAAAAQEGIRETGLNVFVRKSRKSGRKMLTKTSSPPSQPTGPALPDRRDAALRDHPTPQIVAFTVLGVALPRRVSEVRPALETLKAMSVLFKAL